jgi:hypothetical protein
MTVEEKFSFGIKLICLVPLFVRRVVHAQPGRIVPRECEGVCGSGYLKIESVHARTRVTSPACGGGRRARQRNCAPERGGWGNGLSTRTARFAEAPPPQPSPASGRGSSPHLPKHRGFTSERLLRGAVIGRISPKRLCPSAARHRARAGRREDGERICRPHLTGFPPSMSLRWTPTELCR